MKTIRFLIIAALLAAWPVALFAAGGGTSVHAIMIVASNAKGGSDPKLAPYEANLRRILRFESYRVITEGSATVPAGGAATIELTQGHRIELKSEVGAARATWLEGKRMVVAVPLRPGQPAVLGGPAWGDKGEVCAVIIVPQ